MVWSAAARTASAGARTSKLGSVGAIKAPAAPKVTIPAMYKTPKAGGTGIKAPSLRGGLNTKTPKLAAPKALRMGGGIKAPKAPAGTGALQRIAARVKTTAKARSKSATLKSGSWVGKAEKKFAATHKPHAANSTSFKPKGKPAAAPASAPKPAAAATPTHTAPAGSRTSVMGGAPLSSFKPWHKDAGRLPPAGGAKASPGRTSPAPGPMSQTHRPMAYKPTKPPTAKLISKADHPTKHTFRVKVGDRHIKASTTGHTRAEALNKLKSSKTFAGKAHAFLKANPAARKPSVGSDQWIKGKAKAVGGWLKRKLIGHAKDPAVTKMLKKRRKMDRKIAKRMKKMGGDPGILFHSRGNPMAWSKHARAAVEAAVTTHSGKRGMKKGIHKAMSIEDALHHHLGTYKGHVESGMAHKDAMLAVIAKHNQQNKFGDDIPFPANAGKHFLLAAKGEDKSAGKGPIKNSAGRFKPVVDNMKGSTKKIVDAFRPGKKSKLGGKKQRSLQAQHIKDKSTRDAMRKRIISSK